MTFTNPHILIMFIGFAVAIVVVAVYVGRGLYDKMK